MHTPNGTLERGVSPVSFAVHNQPSSGNEQVLVSHVISLPNKDDCDKLTDSVLRLQNELSNLQKSTSEPVIVPICPSGAQDSSPDTPPPPYADKGWFSGIVGCLRPMLSVLGKGAIVDFKSYTYNPDNWEIPFEQITIKDFLGGGGQGSVFSGILNNEQVAVKKVLDIKDTDIRNLRKLNHINIVKFKGVCTQSPCYGIVMEFCPYGPLYHVLKNQKNVVTIHRVVSWAKQITSGMLYLHSQKIIHRDLKSPNVLIGENEVIKISDFGTHRTWNGVSEKMSFAGTVAWMAPEVIRETECSEKVDIWSFGVVLWELLTCEVPYDGMEQSAIMFGVGSGKLKPHIPKTCPEGFKLIMEMCWKHNPKDRPSFKLIQNHLQIASVEVQSKYEDKQFFETQESWKEEIKSHITQFKAQLQKHRIEIHLKEELLIKKRELELKHARDIRELYGRRLEKAHQLYLELAAILQQVEQYRQGSRKRDTQKRRIISPFMKKMEKRRNEQSTTPTSPDCSLTSPDSPQSPARESPYSQLNLISPQEAPQTSQKVRNKRHYRTNSGSPRVSASSRTSSYRSSLGVDMGTQTDSMDLSETDLSPTVSCSQSSTITRRGSINKQPQRVILQESVRNNDSDENDGPDRSSINGNSVKLHYLSQNHEPSAIEVFKRGGDPNMYDDSDALNRNSETLPNNKDYSDEDNLETIGRKVSALKNGNIFADMRISVENGNVTDDIGEVIRKSCQNTRNGQDSTEDACNDSFTDEDGEVYNNVLKRKSLSRRPIYPRRLSRYKHHSYHHQRETNGSDEGDTSEYSISPSSKSSTLDSINFDRSKGASLNPTLKRPNHERSDGSSDSESEENVTTITTQLPHHLNLITIHAENDEVVP